MWDAFKRTVENESEENNADAEELIFKIFEINSMLPRGEYAISL